MPSAPQISAKTTARAIAALREAFEANTLEALGSARTLAALDYLDRALAGHWSVGQFRDSTRTDNETARWQNVNASLNGIVLAAGANPTRQE